MRITTATSRDQDELSGASLCAYVRSAQAPLLRGLVHQNGGFTLDTQSGLLVDRGYAVCADPSRTLGFELADWCDARVASWVDSHLVFSAGHLGGWLDPGGWVWLDLVRIFSEADRAEAFALGRAHWQEAIFDLHRNVSLAVTPWEIAVGSESVNVGER